MMTGLKWTEIEVITNIQGQLMTEYIVTCRLSYPIAHAKNVPVSLQKTHSLGE